ncbi:hypothetical protein DM02DRAFT_240812 [Periconia macrospinosa]|uniref:Uncharacterized protein n=1 Tax=Periconia macrospinosa TaxID=97972 RepID=A0A2V1DZ58_9PLEO|nr:hypothetical protein DM02DRAFT_240812 [Periconia macrospinosa]
MPKDSTKTCDPDTPRTSASDISSHRRLRGPILFSEEYSYGGLNPVARHNHNISHHPPSSSGYPILPLPSLVRSTAQDLTLPSLAVLNLPLPNPPLPNPNLPNNDLPNPTFPNFDPPAPCFRKRSPLHFNVPGPHLPNTNPPDHSNSPLKYPDPAKVNNSPFTVNRHNSQPPLPSAHFPEGWDGMKKGENYEGIEQDENYEESGEDEKITAKEMNLKREKAKGRRKPCVNPKPRTKKSKK